MDTTRDRGSKSPTPSDDEYYDALGESDESDVADTTMRTATSGSLYHLSERASGEREDAGRREERGKSGNSESLFAEKMEEEISMDAADCSTAKTTAFHSPVHSSPASKDGDTDSSTPASASPPPGHLSALSDEFGSCSINDSTCGASIGGAPPDPAIASTSSSVAPVDDTPNSPDTTRSPKDSAAENEINTATDLPPRNNANALSESGASSPKKITKKQSRLKWTAAAREVVQSDGDDGSFRRSSSSSSISSGSDRKISTSSMLDDIAQVRG